MNNKSQIKKITNNHQPKTLKKKKQKNNKQRIGNKRLQKIE